MITGIIKKIFSLSIFFTILFFINTPVSNADTSQLKCTQAIYKSEEKEITYGFDNSIDISQANSNHYRLTIVVEDNFNAQNIIISHLNNIPYPGPTIPNFKQIENKNTWVLENPIQLNTLKKINQFTIRGENETDKYTTTCRIIHNPPVHIDLRQTSNISGAKTTEQINYLGTTTNYSDSVNFQTTISSPGIKGLFANFYTDDEFSILVNNMIVPEINFINERNYFLELTKNNDSNYSILFEGKIKSNYSGVHEIRLQLGQDDYSSLYINNLNTPLITNSDSAYIDLQAGLWYPIRIEYIGNKNKSTDDSISLKWTPPGQIESIISSDYLAYGAGEIASLNQDFDIQIQLPNGLSFNDTNNPPSIIDINGIANPLNTTDYIAPLAISSAEEFQTLTFMFRNQEIPVGKNISILYSADVSFAPNL